MNDMIRELMTANPITLNSGATAQEAARVMRDRDIGDVVVVLSDGTIAMLTDRDLVVRLMAEGLDPKTTTIDAYCSDRVVTVNADESVSRVIGLMRDRAIRRVPVMSDGEVAGIVSIGDLAQVRDPDSALADVSSAPANH